jgi:C-terminal processing protease CtpA/Prc
MASSNSPRMRLCVCARAVSQRGDFVVEIDGIQVDGLQLDKIRDLTIGPVGTLVTLKMLRRDRCPCMHAHT